VLLDEKPDHVTQHWTELVSIESGWKENIELLERTLVDRAMAAAQGKKSKAAEILGIHRRLLYEKLRQYGLDKQDDQALGE
jgi:DNA-binding NtrC family response regulator